MSDSLQIIEQPGARAIVAPEFLSSLHELSALDPERWLRHFEPGRPALAGRLPIATPKLAGGVELVLRRFHHGGLLRRVLRSRLGSPARLFEEFRVHHELATRRAPVPRPAFAVAHRQGALWTGGIATVRVSDAADGSAFLRDQPAASDVHRCAVALGRALRRFHDAGGRHADLHIANMLLCAGEPPQALVLDLDRARAGAPPSIARRAKEIGRLGRSLYKQRLRPDPVDHTAVACFLEAYADGSPTLLIRLRRSLRWRSLGVAVHRAGYALSARDLAS